MQTAYIENLYTQQLISEEEYIALKEQHKQPLSLYNDLHIILYAGILLLATGAGILIYKNIDSIGHGVVVAVIALLCIGCFVYCFKKSPGFFAAKQVSISLLNDYILLLGCLLLLTLTGYLQYQYNLFGNHLGLATFIPMVLLFIAAYYFDNVAILSIAITNLAAWAGITVTPLNILKSNDSSNPHLIYTGLVLSAGLCAVAYASTYKNFKAHFGYTYRNFGIHLLFICLLAGMFYYETFYLLWFLFIAGLSVFIWKYSLTTRSFYFFVIAVLYGYISLMYILFRLIFVLDDEAAFYLYALCLIASAIVLIRILIHYNKIIKQDAGIQR